MHCKHADKTLLLLVGSIILFVGLVGDVPWQEDLIRRNVVSLSARWFVVSWIQYTDIKAFFVVINYTLLSYMN